ncbi:MAG: amidohydrolase [Chitinophagaceae bacterium]|jgi:omega-amidase
MEKLLLTTIQTELHWEDKAANLEMLDRKIDSIQETTHVVVLPEMFSTGFSMKPEQLAETMEGETVTWMKQKSRERNCILTGSLIIKEGDDYYNRLIWMLPNGTYGHYDKRHCFTLAGEHEHYTAGGKRLIASVGGWKINLQICYDLRFPVWARQQLQPDEQKSPIPEYDVLIYVANWPQRRSNAWKTLLQARAIENQSFVVGVNRVGNDGNGIYHSGDSMVIDPLGAVLYHASEKEEINTTVLNRQSLIETRTNLPFWADGDGFILLT